MYNWTISQNHARQVALLNLLSEAIEENPKRFWTYVKQLRQEADLEVEGTIFSDGESKAKIFCRTILFCFYECNWLRSSECRKRAKARYKFSY